jgi:hypothetical protein
VHKAEDRNCYEMPAKERFFIKRAVLQGVDKALSAKMMNRL